MSKILGDSQVRALLDPVEPGRFYPMVGDTVAELKQCARLDAMQALDARLLIAMGRHRTGANQSCALTRRPPEPPLDD